MYQFQRNVHTLCNIISVGEIIHLITISYNNNIINYNN